MKATFVFFGIWEDMKVQFIKKTKLKFIPAEGMQFHFAPEPFELIVDCVFWYHDVKRLVVAFHDTNHRSKAEFIEEIKTLINTYGWNYHANKNTTQTIQKILNNHQA